MLVDGSWMAPNWVPCMHGTSSRPDQAWPASSRFPTQNLVHLFFVIQTASSRARTLCTSRQPARLQAQCLRLAACPKKSAVSLGIHLHSCGTSRYQFLSAFCLASSPWSAGRRLPDWVAATASAAAAGIARRPSDHTRLTWINHTLCWRVRRCDSFRPFGALPFRQQELLPPFSRRKPRAGFFSRGAIEKKFL